MTISDKIRGLCSYSNNIVYANHIDISYTKVESENKLKKLRINRHNTICELLEDKVEQFDQLDEMDTLLFSFKSIKIIGKYYRMLTDEIILSEIIDIINRFTRSNIGMTTEYEKFNCDVILSNDIHNDIEVINKRICIIQSLLSRRRIISNFILINPYDFRYIDTKYLNNEVKIIKSELVSKGKIIIGSDESGIYVNKSDNILYIGESEEFSENIIWFNIK